MNKQAYKQFCDQTPHLPIFFKEWWLNAIYNDNWQCLTHNEGEQITAILPYQLKHTLCYKTIMPAPLTPYTGIYLNLPPELNNNKKYSLQNKALQDIAQQLDNLKISFYTQKYHPTITNWLGLLWNNFQCTTHYTYQFHNLQDLDYTFNQIDKEYRRRIKKHQDQLSLTQDITIEDFYQINNLTYKKQNINCPFTFDYFQRLDTSATLHNASRKLALLDPQGTPIAITYLIIDQNTCYQIFSGSNPAYSHLNPPTILLWKALQYAHSQGCTTYDFTGSIKPNIETFIRHFGATQTPYFYIQKHYSKTYKLLRTLKR
jgi:lipid II:glycine glycyltransferase (peptidoglycan interpeptide bridge formation enzyme)